MYTKQQVEAEVDALKKNGIAAAIIANHTFFYIAWSS